MWTWRSGIVQRLDEYKPVLKRVCSWCLPVGAILSIYVATVTAIIPPGTVSLWAWSSGVLWLPSAHILAAGYISGLALLFMNEGWRHRLLPFAAVGRMALTDYLMQSVLCTLFFYHYTTALYGRIGPAVGLFPTVVLYSAQVVFSNWWLRRYRFGPMEWLWRGLTYGKFPSMYRDEPTLALEAAPSPAALAGLPPVAEAQVTTAAKSDGIAS